jgi:surfeit locus 1 family protein
MRRVASLALPMTATLETREARDDRRTSPAWRAVVAAATVAAIALFVAAGNWQRDRMHAKEAARAALDAAAALPAVPLPRTDDWSEWRYRRVTLSGEWRGDAQVLIDNKVQGGRAGFHVVTPLALGDGRVVLVDRGWIAAAGATRVPDVAAPAGKATVDGRIVVPPARYVELDGGASAGRVWQNLDPARIAAASGLPLLSVVVEQDAAGAPADGLVRAWAAPDTGVDTHRIYMMQWYAFAALAAGLWIGFAVRRAMRGRRRR